MEQEEYSKEEIDWSYIEFVDNQDMLDLIEKVCCGCSLVSDDGVFLLKFIYFISSLFACLFNC